MTLTDIKVRTTKPSDKPFKLTDGQGMHLLINPNASKYWRLQYRFDGKQNVLALGVYPIVSLSEARRKRVVPYGLLNIWAKMLTAIEFSNEFNGSVT